MAGRLQEVRLRRAGPGDAATLSSLAFRSKASWGYDIGFMKRCRAELTYAPENIEAPRFNFHVCECGDEAVGFYALELQGDGQAELEALFIKPGFMRRGLGRMLMEHMKGQARLLGIRAVTILGDPNAEEFYLAMGATPAGYRESSSIKGRFLPVFVLSLDQEE